MTELQKNIIPTRLLWIDLEMTGLRPETDIILEVAAVVTDFQFREIGRYESTVRYPKDEIKRLMDDNPWYEMYPDNKAHFLAQADQGKLPADVEMELIAFVREKFGDEPAVLAGNSIHNDRNFIRHWWPKLDAKLHYRMLDVSAWKVYMQGAYGIEYQKKESHRALGDVAESIDELRYYLRWFREQGDRA